MYRRRGLQCRSGGEPAGSNPRIFSGWGSLKKNRKIGWGSDPSRTAWFPFIKDRARSNPFLTQVVRGGGGGMTRS